MILKHVRYSWASWLTVAAGLLASTFAVTLSMLGLAVGVGQDDLQPGVLTNEQREWMFSISGFNLGICVMVMMFVASTSVRVLIAQQRHMLGQLALLGATPGQLFRLIMGELALVTVVLEALLMVVIAGLLALAADWMITLFTGWAMQQVLGVGSAQFAWLFFVVCMGIAAVLLIAAVLVPGRRTRLADLHRD